MTATEGAVKAVYVESLDIYQRWLKAGALDAPGMDSRAKVYAAATTDIAKLCRDLWWAIALLEGGDDRA